MTKQPIIYTDMDGTLLDHYDYSFTEAIPVMEALAERKIPIIANTSKTFAEMESIQQTLGFNAPFICENGAAVYIPKGYFTTQPQDTEERGYYWVKSFCQPRSHWIEVLTTQVTEFKKYYVGFSAMTVESLCSVTELTPAKAKLALMREHTEPLLWLGSENIKQQFIEKMQQLGAEMLEGGRFLHVGGQSDKAQAMNWLTMLYAFERAQTMYTIALGDSGNDIAMLNAADVAVQIKSPVHDFPLLHTKKPVLKSPYPGPRGWAHCLSELLLTPSLVEICDRAANQGA
ncbi:HAD-IIB family hydrolase [Shewanella maritima]|nr:HAD-IIB family hydrolase [Shewanella maritima]